MRLLCLNRTLPHLRDLRFLAAVSVVHATQGLDHSCGLIAPRCRVTVCVPARGTKTKTSINLRDTPQGMIESEALPELEADDAPQYPTVVQGARNNMIKFRDCVVLTRVGSFYELYLEHAEQYAPLLNLKLSSKKTCVGPVPMAGFPFFQLDRFLKLLVQDLNKHVAISEEFPINTSDRVKSGGLMFDRKVARVVTPGTLIDEKFIDPSENNFLLSIHHVSSEKPSQQALDQPEHLEEKTKKQVEQRLGLAWLDLSTGHFFTQTTTVSMLSSVIARIRPREVLLDPTFVSSHRSLLEQILGQTHLPTTTHTSNGNKKSLSEWGQAFEAPIDPGLEASFTNEEIVAIHYLLDYVMDQLQGLELKLQPPRRKLPQETMTIDRNSLRGLEILETARDGLGKGSLLHTVRRTSTKGGSRLLRDHLSAPSASIPEIDARLDLIATFLDDTNLREEVVNLLKRSHDAQRLVQKFSLNKADADDLVCLARAIEASKSIQRNLKRAVQEADAPVRQNPGAMSSLLLRFDLDGPAQLSQQILAAIDEDGLTQKHRSEQSETEDVVAQAQDIIMSEALPEEIETMPERLRKRKKGLESKEADAELEETWMMRKEASDALLSIHGTLDRLLQEKSDLAQDLRNKLKAPTLILKWTPGLGHICHVRGVSKISLDSLGGRVVSSTKSTRSYYLTSWSRLGSQLEQTRASIRQEEHRIFAILRSTVIRHMVKIRRNAAVLDELDVACSFAILAEEQDWHRPKLNAGTQHKIVGGRHPTVTLGLEEKGRPFVSNDLFLGDDERVWLVTGPNMAGKSTFLRQNALISILAQVGSYVPAEYAEIGVVDQVFSRIGAADDLFRDQSTFMVEMLETATILRQATPRSFVIMDEVGRGTTPEDGIAVGYACLHHLHYLNQCRTLFATHFHALADMTRGFQYIGRYCTDVIEEGQGSFTYKHRLKQGVNRQSHALKVARLAGIPETAISTARDVLQNLPKHASPP